MQPKFTICYSPERPGYVTASLYVPSIADIHGWHLEAKKEYFSAAFFTVENFYAEHAMHLYRSVQDDVYSPWTIDYPPAGDRIRCPMPEVICHELERLQSRFVHDWLFFKDDPNASAEVDAYNMLGLPVHDVNVRPRRMHRFERKGNVWRCMSAGADQNVDEMLRKYWRLGEKISMR